MREYTKIFKIPVKGVHIGPLCIDGTTFGKTEALRGGQPAGAHAHTEEKDRFRGWICAISPVELQHLLTHEIAHLATNAGHDDRWRRAVRCMGGRVEAAYQKRPRK